MPVDPAPKSALPRRVRRLPAKSFWYDRVVPFALLALALLLGIVLLFAFAILLGLLRF